MIDETFLPEPPPTPTPSETAALAAAAAGEVLRASRQKAELEALDIIDPSERRPAAPAAAKPVPTVALAAGAAVPSFSDDLLRRAADAGMTPDEAKGYGNPQLLERTLGMFDRQFGRRFQNPPAAQAAAAATEPEPEPEWPDLDPEKYDEGLVSAFKAQKEFITRQSKQLQEALGQVKNLATGQQAERARQIDQQFEEHFASLGEEYHETIGKGTFHQLGASSPQVQTRMEIARTAKGIENAYRESGRNPPPLKEILTRATRAVCGDKVSTKVEAAAGEEVAAKLRSATGQFISRPTATPGDSDKPPSDPKLREKWATDRLAQRMRLREQHSDE